MANSVPALRFRGKKPQADGDVESMSKGKTSNPTDTKSEDVEPNKNEGQSDDKERASSEKTKPSEDTNGATAPSETAPETEEKKFKRVNPSEEKLTFTNVVLALKLLPRVLNICWNAQPYLCTLMMTITALNGIEPLFRIGTDAMLLDVVMTAIKTQDMSAIRSILYVILMQIVVDFFSHILNAVQNIVQQQLQSSVNTYLDLAIMEHTLKLDLAYFEDPTMSDIIREADQMGGYYPVATLRSILGAFQQTIVFVSMSALLFNNPKWPVIVPVALLNPALSFFIGLQLSFASYQRFTQDRTPRRMMHYITDLITSESAQKELKLFDVGRHFIEIYKQAHMKIKDNGQMDKLIEQAVWIVLNTFSNLTQSYVYYIVAVQAIHETISVGDLTRYTTATTRFGSSFRGVLSEISSVYDRCLRLKVVFDFFDLKPQISYPEEGVKYQETENAMVLADAAQGHKISSINQDLLFDKNPQSQASSSFEICPDISYGIVTTGSTSINRSLGGQHGMKIEFRNVSFKYPGKDEYCLKGINFVIEPGEIIALVGYNGAGKTTLVKLMMRLYAPDSGDILINNRNIKDFDLPDLRSHVSIIFQDFNRYEMKVSENIGIGSILHMHEDSSIHIAATKSGADEVIAKLSSQYDHQLGRRFHEEGAELSGGEWQKVALSRAFMRDAEARLLVLDEPTSALDARAEHEVFAKIRALSSGKTAIFISHRFSTVRNADRILVIEEGVIRENGSHDELLELDGRYAELFNLQAEAYK